MFPIVYVHRWTRESVAADPRTLYIFGDNYLRWGSKGQAVIRGMPNAFGIPTKRAPSYLETAYFSDATYDSHVAMIDSAFRDVDQLIRSGAFDRLALPEDGLGTGLAELDKRAPRVLEYLNARLRDINHLS